MLSGRQHGFLIGLQRTEILGAFLIVIKRYIKGGQS
jgi:hypothetical protein